ncbi:DUF2140 family protein [Mammaliicoccus stepanovicii]|uniref:Uncharacterized protein conserved in bacteria n=1 Tax=Mammaliicoccus stepanovicii TaxID=643214 RepID=A0A239ZA61_9STAP|nr:DUF2140 family protein [Mammaliicoccus stepanovicii]PNZ73865.1 DUF2140 domain-containing protein [Mammaliicoccus stepanovicii]SNV68069.1 Uncharacterized protein conserved in bacteria [Mammaliicoccus stepanovicii]
MENRHWMNHRFWFFAFITIIIFILIAMVYVYMSVSDSQGTPPKNAYSGKKDFTLALNNNELETFINKSLVDYDIKSNVSRNNLSFYTRTKILSKKIDIKLNTKPEKLNTNTIKFNIKSIDIGKLNISNPFVLSQIKKYGNFPEYISINPKDESIYLSLNKIKIENVESVKIQRLDISDKKWYFDIKLK